MLAYAAPGAPAQEMILNLFSGATATVQGVTGNAETSVGEASAAWSQSGPAVWVDWDGDPKTIESVQYNDPQRDQRVVRRATLAERVNSAVGWNTIRVVLAIVILSAMGDFDFSPVDFDPLEFL